MLTIIKKKIKPWGRRKCLERSVTVLQKESVPRDC